MEEIISNLGFPIACVVGLAYYFVQKDKASREDNKLDRELYRDTIDKFDSKLDKFAIALENNNSELSVIKDDIRNIKEKVGV